ncbi:hypothetical protein OG394_26145 [Kribbella sp. NBC_01245]|uniref:hypothetical protein n=1 Tax=Kribbella sp. NBC_01245 TaxID=2903578 RepID=UPI002E281B92|nr:hypothetical protein [Kribbella sp. NBC_01245]
MTARVLDLAGRIALVLCLFALSVYFVVRPFLGDDYENMQRAKAINQVVERGGPVKVDGIEWKVNSMKAYTRLLNEDREAIDLDVPAGAIVVVVEATVTADKTVVVDGEGYSCNAELADDRGNRWEEKSAYGYTMPTYCTNSDNPAKREVPFKVAKIFLVPKSAVPHLLGIIVPPETRTEQRTLIRP